jgi:hypothetical protein
MKVFMVYYSVNEMISSIVGLFDTIEKAIEIMQERNHIQVISITYSKCQIKSCIVQISKYIMFHVI